MNKFWSVKNFVNQDGTGQSELILYGDISDTSWWGDEVTPREFASDLASCNGNDLTMRINSGGGDVFAAQAIHNMIKTYTGNVTAHIDGLCASAATIIACAADKVIMPSNALYMIHNPSVYLGDSFDADGLTKMANYLASVKQTIANVYLGRSDVLTSEQVNTLMDDETWLTADEAKSYGLIDEVDTAITDKAVMNNGMVIVNKVSCKYSAKNEAKIKQFLTSKEKPMTENQFMASLKGLLGISTNEPAENAAVTAERERVEALNALKGDNEVINRLVDVAVAEGKTVDEVTPFISAVSDIPTTDNKVVDQIRQLVIDQMESGADKVAPQGASTPETNDAVAKASAIDEVVAFANAKKGGK